MTLPILENRNSRRAVIVAHPDDEVLWAGGLMLTFPGDWLVICASIPGRDPFRAYLFYEACRRLGAVGQILPFPETNALKRLPLPHLAYMPDLSAFDVIVTHGLRGEYGNTHHVQLHHAVGGRYPGIPMVFFDYGTAAAGDINIELSEAMAARKLHALKAYDNAIIRGGQRFITWQDVFHTFYQSDPAKLGREKHRIR